MKQYFAKRRPEKSGIELDGGGKRRTRGLNGRSRKTWGLKRLPSSRGFSSSAQHLCPLTHTTGKTPRSQPSQRKRKEGPKVVTGRSALDPRVTDGGGGKNNRPESGGTEKNTKRGGLSRGGGQQWKIGVWTGRNKGRLRVTLPVQQCWDFVETK